ncbi:MAG: ATP-binding protein [Erysipelotrichaceae bacterium]|nr:ATP-binding protein [Erysipelotrichaceae bacterium]
MEIRRDVYLNRLIVRKHNGFIKVITGIRRCGKSYLLNKLFYNHLRDTGVDADHIIMFAFDSADDLVKIEEDPLLLDNDKENRKVNPTKFLKYVSSQIKDEGMYYLLLDEVQKLGAFESVLNGFLRKNNTDVFVTGSNSRFLSKDILTEFEGRGDEIHVLPLSFSEFYGAYEGSKEEAYDEYSLYGGLPAVALMKTEEQKAVYLTTQMKNVYLKDLLVRYNLQSDVAIGELTDVIASGISSLTNPKKLSATFASVKQTTISDVTIGKYIGYMEDAFLICRVKRYDVKGRKYIGTPYKVYFEDIGLRNAQLNFRQTEATHIMENILYNELRFRGYNVDVGVVESREKDEFGKEVRKQLEIDFVATLGSKKYYIQSAYAITDEKKYKQETKPFGKTGDSFKKIILVEQSMKPRRDENGYVCMGVKEFLLDANSLDI